MTRQQRYLAQALDHVGRIARETEPGSDRRRIYGGLCHTFPVLVRTNGLCQTLAYVEEKASGRNERAAAYRDLRLHVAETLGVTGDLLGAIRSADHAAYLSYTRALLEAWIYYKRLAVSVLDIQAGTDDKGEA